MNVTGPARKLRYSAGLLVLSERHPSVIRYRSPEPVLTPELTEEREGSVANVVFPTAIDRRDDLGLPSRFDVYYGMADSRIGVARLDYPEHLPSEAEIELREATRRTFEDAALPESVKKGPQVTIGQ